MDARSSAEAVARCGAVDGPSDRSMYDRSIGCQVRTVRDLKKDEVALSIPISAMVTPDLIEASDAGQALLACCDRRGGDGGGGGASSSSGGSVNFWDAFGVTSKLEKMQASKIQQCNGTQLLVKILQERKKVETALARAAVEAEKRRADGEEGDDDAAAIGATGKLARMGALSRRAPYLAFLVHQRFADEREPLVASDSMSAHNDDLPNPPADMPETFAPYVRTLPSSVCLPICWKRNELALLAGCIPGMPALQKVACRTVQLAAELIALAEAGLLWRFPDVFVPGMITWDRWVWAAAVFESRAMMAGSLPAWLFSGGGGGGGGGGDDNIWESCGVMVPFLDMLNHEDDAAQAHWRNSTADDADEDGVRRLNVTTDGKTKKHMQVYRNYGTLDNEHFMLQFGFTRMSNPADRVRIAWALVDGVGGVSPPADYEAVSDVAGMHASHLVFESTDAVPLKAWWTEGRISLLGRATSNAGVDTLDSLRKGKKITFCAFNNGRIDPMLIAVAVVATLPPAKVREMMSSRGPSSDANSSSPSSKKPLDGLVLDKSCQHSVRLYLSFLFSKKLGKLLQSLNSCLKDHFNSVQLWTKASMGGLNYVANTDKGKNSAGLAAGGADSSSKSGAAVMGWQSFFDTYAWYSTMEVEERYYSMAPDSCVLTLYDGHVRSLQNSLDIMATDALFQQSMKRPLEDLGCTLDDAVTTPTPMDIQPVVTPTAVAAPAEEEAEEQRVKLKSSEEVGKAGAAQDPSPPKKDEQQGNGNKQQGNNNDRRISKDRVNNTSSAAKGSSSGDANRPPAIKLHIGNLSYKTMPNQLYDFFTRLYGKDSVLECHIPTERDTGNSRGFGFVTMPDQHAKAALESGKKHEMDGRILKVAESNSAGSNKGNRQGRGGGGGGGSGPAPSSDRCPNCGYRPRWCTCNGSPNLMPMNHHMGGMGGMGGPHPGLDNIYGPGPYGVPPPPPPPPMGGPPGYGHAGHHDMDDRRMGGDGHGGWGGGGGGWGGSRRSHSRSPSYHRRDRDRDRDRGYRRSRSYSRSRSRSYSRDRGRGGGGDRHHRSRHDEDLRRSRYDDDRRGSGGRGSSRRYRSKSRSRSPRRRDDVGAGASPEGRVVVGEGGNGGGGRSHSRSPSLADANGMERKKRDDRKDSSGGRGGGSGRSRSRDRGSSSRRRKRSKGSRRDRKESSSSKRRGGSRSRSRDRH